MMFENHSVYKKNVFGNYCYLIILLSILLSMLFGMESLRSTTDCFKSTQNDFNVNCVWKIKYMTL